MKVHLGDFSFRWIKKLRASRIFRRWHFRIRQWKESPKNFPGKNFYKNCLQATVTAWREIWRTVQLSAKIPQIAKMCVSVCVTCICLGVQVCTFVCKMCVFVCVSVRTFVCRMRVFVCVCVCVCVCVRCVSSLCVECVFVWHSLLLAANNVETVI